MAEFFVDIAVGFVTLAGFVWIVLLVELALPKGPLLSVDDRLRAFWFALVYIPVGVLCSYAVRPLVGQPLLSFGLLSIVLVPFVWDFFYYWLHRAQHSIPFLWRFHAVHHSIEQLGAGSGFHHPAEAPLRAALVTIPLAFLTTRPALAGAILGLHGIYLHSTARLHFGPFAWLVADNRVHRIHHSLEPKHFDRNFGAFTMLWDRLFGTAYFPGSEWPDVGLADRREPRSIREFAMQPFRSAQ